MIEQNRSRSTTTIHHPKCRELYNALNAAVSGECNFSAAAVAMYSSDASNYRQIPLGVIYPETTDDIEKAMAICRTHGVAILMRGGGTSQNGQAVNEVVVLDCSQHLSQVISIDVDSRSALVQPGIVCDSLKQQAEQHGLTWGPDPATHSRCTLGGMIGNNSCGPHSMLAGKTVENVLELEVLTHDGARFWTGPTSEAELAQIIAKGDRQAEIYHELKSIRDQYADLIRQRYPTIKRRVSGYNLDQLLPENGFNVARALVGSEGTCVSILQARLNLIENPKYKQLVVLGFDDIFTAGDSVPEIMPFAPIAMEGLDWTIIGGLNDRNLKQAEVALLPEGRAWLLVELASNTFDDLKIQHSRFTDAMQRSSMVRSVLSVNDEKTVKDIWSIREQGASATSMALHPDDPDPIVGWEDTAVDPMQLGDYLREFSQLVDRYGYTTSLYGHFGDGCIHARITFDTRSENGVEQWRQFSVDIANLVVRYGGSLSGEHGDGQAKAEFLPIMFGPDLINAFERFKNAWDPQTCMNPRKLVQPYRMDENLRYGPDYQLPVVETTLQFIEDKGGFGRTTERCIGMGKCRAASGAMCPSYQATGEERYSTRGRARLLHELVRGEVISDGWANPDIAESLEHCLSCKACKSECPTQVDIASYKAEFMAKHYSAVKRPLQHYMLGYIGTLLPFMARLPGFTNTLLSGIGGTLLQRGLGLSNGKSLPSLAPQPFNQWARQHADHQDEHFYWFGQSAAPPCVLWSDSTNSAYRPHLLASAINVLQKSGKRVAVAKQHFCCGRPLYEYGFLQRAQTQLAKILDGFQSTLPAGASVIVLEPSCLSVFKEELLRLYPEDKRASNLSQRCKTLTEVLNESGIQLNRTLANGIMHLHCHHNSTDKSSHEREIMHRCFDTLLEPEDGCCGMAGTYGLKTKTRAIGQWLFNRRLQPAISNAAANTYVVTNGYSCAEQFSDTAYANNTRVLHPVEVIEMCL